MRFFGISIFIFVVFLQRSADASDFKTFFWGVTNAAFQVEGSPPKSDWFQFSHSPGKIHDGSNADKATNFWNDYDKDFKLAAQIKLNAFRISISWARIQPSSDSWDLEALAHYRKMIERMRHYGLEPIVTLHHFDIPLWLHQQGGLASDKFSQYFAEYSLRVVSALSTPPANVHYWMTFNEPNVEVMFGFMDGSWPPEKKDPRLALKAMANIAEGHLLAVNRIRLLPNSNDLKIGIAQHWRIFQPKSKFNILHWLIAKLSDQLFNRQLIRSISSGHILLWLPGALYIKKEIPIIGGPSLDFLGINYYGRMIVSIGTKVAFVNAEEGPGIKNDLGWEIYPAGLTKAIEDASSYGLPIIVSENGIADRSDEKRSQFLDAHLEALSKAKKSGYPVFGYLYWSLTDNFEWADGFFPRFGLVEMDYKTMERKPRASYFHYGDLIKKIGF